jgi:hypothetical protein
MLLKMSVTVVQVYRRDGRNPLFIYYFTSERDRLSLWVIGPQLGQFIAGIRNSNPGNCVHELGSGWKYASRSVKCNVHTVENC